MSGNINNWNSTPSHTQSLQIYSIYHCHDDDARQAKINVGDTRKGEAEAEEEEEKPQLQPFSYK